MTKVRFVDGDRWVYGEVSLDIGLTDLVDVRTEDNTLNRGREALKYAPGEGKINKEKVTGARGQQNVPTGGLDQGSKVIAGNGSSKVESHPLDLVQRPIDW